MREGQQGAINESVTQSSRAGASLELDDTRTFRLGQAAKLNRMLHCAYPPIH